MLGIREALLFLAVVVVAVPLFKRLGLGSVLGYLVAGVLIGPHGLRLIPDVEAVGHLAELGVVLLLFLIGLELQPQRLWELRTRVFGVGGAQVALSGAVLAVAALALGLSWQAALVAGLGLSLSSTAFALQLLGERNQLGDADGADGLRDPPLPGPGGDSPPGASCRCSGRAGREATPRGCRWPRPSGWWSSSSWWGGRCCGPPSALVASARSQEVFTASALLAGARDAPSSPRPSA